MATAAAAAAPFPLSAIRLSAGSAFAEAQRLNTEYLRYLDLDRLLYTFRLQAGLPNHSAEPYGGWENPNYQWGLLNGHFTGHLMSALAFAAAAGDANMGTKGARLVSELARCQTAIARATPQLSGWLSAYGIDQLERLEAHNATHVWAPYYTLHKIMAGLYDQHVSAGNAQALDVLEALADFLSARIAALIEAKGAAWWQTCLDTEFGGMNEVAYNLYTLTGSATHLALANYFSPDDFYAPLASGEVDPLDGLHANQHLPIVVGAARGYEVTRNTTLANVTTHFDCLLRTRYSYATGGSNVNEHWSGPRQLGQSIETSFDEQSHAPHNSNGFHTQETCTTYNALKLARHLFGWAPSVAAADTYERRLLNGILGTQRPGVVGSMSYMTPLGRGVNRNKWDWYGFGTPDASFWCCYGTSIEQFAKLGDSIYFQSAAEAAHGAGAGGSDEEGATTGGNATAASGFEGGAESPTLYVAQYIPSTLVWAEASVRVSLSARMQLGGDPPMRTARPAGWGGGAAPLRAGLAVNVSVAPLANRSHASSSSSSAAAVRLRLRVPGWAAAGSTVQVVRAAGHGDGAGDSDARLGSRPTPVANGTFCSVDAPSGGWQEGDHVQLWLAMATRLERLNDDREAYASVGAVMLGPMLLAAITNESDVLRADPAKIGEWVVLTPPDLGSDSGGVEEQKGPRHGGGAAAPWAIWGHPVGRGAATPGVEDADAVAPDLAVVAVGQGRNYTLQPLSRIALQNYSAYLNVSLQP